MKLKAALSILILMFAFLPGLGKADDAPRTINLRACIDGVDRLHVKAGLLFWQHLSWSPPGTHQDCAGVLSVDGRRWTDWQSPFPFAVTSDNPGQLKTDDSTMVRSRNIEESSQPIGSCRERDRRHDDGEAAI